MIKVGFVSTEYYSADSVRSWSGLPFHMARCLRNEGFEVVPVPVADNENGPLELLQFVLWKILGRRFLRDRTPRVLRKIGRQVKAALAARPVDALFAPSSLLVAQGPADVPAFFWTDATFGGMLGFYESFSNLAFASQGHGYAADRRALARARVAIYASDWAAAGARALSPESADKVRVLPFGANLDVIPSAEEAVRAAERRRGDPVRLLFLGVDWVRKGGDFALEVAREWRARGETVELHVAGCEPPRDAGTLPWVVNHGFVSKASPEGQRVLSRVLESSDWLVLPSRAECFGIVFSEAAAHALPSAATRIGGIPSAVADDRTGCLFGPKEPATAWVNRLQRITSDRRRYLQMAVSAREEYDVRLDWKRSGAQLAGWIRRAVSDAAEKRMPR